MPSLLIKPVADPDPNDAACRLHTGVVKTAIKMGGRVDIAFVSIWKQVLYHFRGVLVPKFSKKELTKSTARTCKIPKSSKSRLMCRTGISDVGEIKRFAELARGAESFGPAVWTRSSAEEEKRGTSSRS